MGRYISAIAIGAEVEEGLASKFAVVFPHLDERQRRLLMGAEARGLGHGGIKMVVRAAGVSAVTVSRGAAELESGQDPLGRTRRPGRGRRRLTSTDSGLVAALLALVRARRARRPVLAAAVDDQVDPDSGRGVDPGRASGLGVDGGQPVA